MSALLDRYGRPLAAKAEKAATGPGVAALMWDSQQIAERNPLRRMQTAQMLYWTHPWVRSAEWAVTRRVAGMPWHLETGEDDEVTAGPAYDVLTDPVGAYVRPPQVIRTSRDLIEITSRHVGLCGVAYWYFDKREPVGNVPTGILYINPARLYPATDRSGALLYWVLDPSSISGTDVFGGVRLEIEEILPFYLSLPDWGYMPSGLVEVARLKAQITTLADQHASFVLSSGGRLAGIVSPKEGLMPDEAYHTLVREFRNVAELPDAAKRTIIMQGPVDFKATAANPSELNLIELNDQSKEDIHTIWGVPVGMASRATTGLNGGESRKYDEAELMKGPVHDRIEAIRTSIQIDLLARYAKGEKLVFEEPTFDDESPAYELATKAERLPITRNEMRAIIGLDPLPEYGPDGDPLGLAIDLPIGLTTVGQGPQETGEFSKAPSVPEPVLPVVAPEPPAGPFPPAKASLRKPIEALRKKVDERHIPILQAAVLRVLHQQRDEIAAWVAEHPDHIARKNDPGWWNQRKWDRLLRAALEPTRGRIAEHVTGRVQSAMTGKATLTENITARVVRRGASRVARINETTREKIAAVVQAGIEQGLTAQEIAALVGSATGFDEARAEVIARTETMAAYNEAALESYTEFGVEMVEPIDGDEDDECQARLARGAVTIDEALADEDHPNGTLDWVPVIEAPAKAALTIEEVLAAVRAQLPPSVSITSAAPAPIVEFDYGMDGKIVRMREVRA